MLTYASKSLLSNIRHDEEEAEPVSDEGHYEVPTDHGAPDPVLSEFE